MRKKKKTHNIFVVTALIIESVCLAIKLRFLSRQILKYATAACLDILLHINIISSFEKMINVSFFTAGVEKGIHRH
jgi:hypothetical protein